jgi:DNA polymerase-3 subunit epsilon
MGQQLDRTVTEFADALERAGPWRTCSAPTLSATQRRVQRSASTKTEEVAGDVVRVDTLSLLQALTYLVFRLRDEHEIREVRFRLAAEGRLAHFDLIWAGAGVGSQALPAWEIEPMNACGEVSPLTLREVIERHGGEIWFEREKASDHSFFRLLIPRRPRTLSFAGWTGAGPEYYDFDSSADGGERASTTGVDELTTVFDIETTGPDLGRGNHP